MAYINKSLILKNVRIKPHLQCQPRKSTDVVREKAKVIPRKRTRNGKLLAREKWKAEMGILKLDLETNSKFGNEECCVVCLKILRVRARLDIRVIQGLERGTPAKKCRGEARDLESGLN